jgi:pyruvate dehydrogenase E1 component
MYEEQENIFYYLTVYNENYAMPSMPEEAKQGILKGMYKFKSSSLPDAKLHAQLIGSGPMMNEVLKAQKILEEKYKIAANVWSVTSYKELRRDGLETERWNMLHPNEQPRIPYITRCFANEKGVFVASSDYIKVLPDSISRWIPGPLTSLGTDGFGRSESRPQLRNFFEVDARYITLAVLNSLCRKKELSVEVVRQAMKDLEINPEKSNPVIS